MPSNEIKQEDIEKFKIAIDLAKNEGPLAWQVYGIFLVIDILFLGFILKFFEKPITPESLKNNWLIPAFGMLFCIVWYGIFVRFQAAYELRMAIARKSEPPDWELVGGKVEDFFNGSKIKVDGSDYQIPYLGREFRGISAGNFIIGISFILYLLILCITLFL